MKNECSIIKDLLPLYVEGMVSKDTKEFIENHINECKLCKQEYELLISDMNIQSDIEEDNDPIKSMEKIKSNINKNRVETILISTLIAIIMVITICVNLSAPNYIAYSDLSEPITIVEENGIISLTFTGDYKLSERSNENEYSITLYTTLWNQIWGTPKEQTIIVNPNKEEVDLIYYVSNGEELNEVIYGENPFSVYGDTNFTGGGVITLPRLVLNYYFLIVLAITLLLGFILLCVKSLPRVKTTIMLLIGFPISYMTSHMLTIGGLNSTYDAIRDLYLILVLSVPVYAVYYLLYKKYLQRKEYSLSNL